MISFKKGFIGFSGLVPCTFLRTPCQKLKNNVQLAQSYNYLYIAIYEMPSYFSCRVCTKFQTLDCFILKTHLKTTFIQPNVSIFIILNMDH